METRHYHTIIRWTGNRGTGTSGHTAYSRDFIASIPGKADIAGSADPAFRGDARRWNPEAMLLAAISASHQLWYLQLCADHGIDVLAYEDHAEGELDEGDSRNPGGFLSAILHPNVTIDANSDATLALALHERAHHSCYIGHSLTFPVYYRPQIHTAIARDQLT